MDLEQKEQKVRIDQRNLNGKTNDFEGDFDKSESNEKSTVSKNIPGQLPILILPDLFSKSNKNAFRIRWQITNSKKVIILNQNSTE